MHKSHYTRSPNICMITRLCHVRSRHVRLKVLDTWRLMWTSCAFVLFQMTEHIKDLTVPQIESKVLKVFDRHVSSWLQSIKTCQRGQPAIPILLKSASDLPLIVSSLDFVCLFRSYEENYHWFLFAFSVFYHVLIFILISFHVKCCYCFRSVRSYAQKCYFGTNTC